jgi:triosephosphate isomerase
MINNPLMAGNWKMYKTPTETQHFFEEFNALIAAARYCEILICPPALDLTTAVAAKIDNNVAIGAQNLYPRKEGTLTGEISGRMIKSASCTHVLIVHTERRRYFRETDANVFEKTVAALEVGLTPVVPVGEVLEERESGMTEQVLVRRSLLPSESFPDHDYPSARSSRRYSDSRPALHKQIRRDHGSAD